MKMKVPRIAAVLTVSVIMAMVLGCESGPTPTEQATAAVADYHAALEAQNVEGMMALVSNDFSGPLGFNKVRLRTLFEALFIQGLKSSVVKCDTVAQEDSASAISVYSSHVGPNTSSKMTLKKEADGVWRIVSSEQLY
jgi:hypothetical protein